MFKNSNKTQISLIALTVISSLALVVSGIISGMERYQDDPTGIGKISVFIFTPLAFAPALVFFGAIYSNIMAFISVLINKSVKNRVIKILSLLMITVINVSIYFFPQGAEGIVAEWISMAFFITFPIQLAVGLIILFPKEK